MLSKTSKAVCLTSLLLLMTSLVEAAPPFTPPGPPPWVQKTVPIPGTTLVLFGGGILLLPWLRSRKK